jgi:hypothetical protein
MGFFEKKQYYEANNISKNIGVNVGTKGSGNGTYPQWVYIVQEGKTVIAPEELPGATVQTVEETVLTVSAPTVAPPAAPASSAPPAAPAAPAPIFTTPSAPAITSVTAGNTILTVVFTAPASDGGSAITGYEISTNNGSTYSSAGSSPGSITVTGLTNGTIYQVVVRAVNSVGSGTASTAVSGTPTAPAAAPLNPVSWGINAQQLQLFSTIAVDSQDNVYTFGVLNYVGFTVNNFSMIDSNQIKQTPFGTMPTSIVRGLLLIKYNSQGQVQWVNCIEPPSSGSFLNNFRLSIDANDNLVVSFVFGYSSIQSNSIIINQYNGKDGSDVIQFQRVGTFTTIPSENSWIFKLQSNGTFDWMTKLDNPYYTSSVQRIHDIVIDTNANIYAVGVFGSINANLLQNTVTLYNSSIIPGTESPISFIPYGLLSIPNSGCAAGFIIKYSSLGQVEWTHMLLNTWKSGAVRYSAICQSIMIDSNNSILVRGQLLGIANLNIVSGISIPDPVANQVTSWNYTTTGALFSPSLYSFDSIVPVTVNTAIINGIKVNLTAQLSIGFVPSSTSATILMKLNANGTVQWINYVQTAGSQIYKSSAVDSFNNYYIGFDQPSFAIPLYAPLSSATSGTVWSFQVDGAKQIEYALSSKNICKIDTNGNIVAVAKLYSPISGFNVNFSFILDITSSNELLVSGQFLHTGTSKEMYITNFVELNASSIFAPTTNLYTKLPIVQDQDTYLIKFTSALQGAYAYNINTGTSGGTVSEIFLYMSVKGNYVYMGVRYPTQDLKLQSFTGINATTQVAEQTGSLVLSYNSAPVNGTSIIANNALLKYSL